jgi:hypothetical protein
MLTKIFFSFFHLYFLIALGLLLLDVGSVDGIRTAALNKTEEDKQDVPKQVKFDTDGVL